MTRQFVTRALGWKSLVAAAILLVTVLAGVLVARQHGAVEASAVQSGSFLRTARDEKGAAVVEVDLDTVLGQVGSGVVLDRPVLLRLLQQVVGEDPEIESKSISVVLAKVQRVRVLSEGLSLTVGRRVIERSLSHLIGADGNLQQMTVGEVLDGLAGAQLTPDGITGLLDEDGVAALVGGALDVAQRAVAPRDPQFLRRQTMLNRWALVTALVKDLRRQGMRNGDPTLFYNAAHDQLVAQKQRAAIPLLDGYLRLEGELKAIQVGAATRAERIPLRWAARRKVFDEPVARLLFGRDEAIERYELDRLALEADENLTPTAKTQRLRARREALKVELAAQGTYVGFAGAARTVGSGAPDADQAGAEEGGAQ